MIIGFNEIDDKGNIFDSAVVIEKGNLIGIQRKHYQYHQFCSKSEKFIPFSSKGILFGVVICLDSNYFEPSRILALQGATILFVPSCNKVSFQHAFSKRPSYYSHFAARSHENRCWLLSADWVFKDKHFICPGHSVVYDDNGQELYRSKEFEEDLIIVDISNNFFKQKKGQRVFGSKVLSDNLRKIYNKVLK